MRNAVKYFNLNFLRKEKISKDVFTFYFNRKNLSFNFLAGQYIHLYLPIENEKGRGNSRMFTISSSPLEKDYVLITVKKGKSLFKKSLFKLIPQTIVKFYGPSGGLVLNKPRSSYVFLSMGIGITPFRSIIKYVGQKKLDTRITLIASFSNKNNFCFYDELMRISKLNPNIKIIYSLDRVNDGLIRKYIKSINNHLYFIVGAPSGVADLEEVVSGMGVPNEKIFIEDFEGY